MISNGDSIFPHKRIHKAVWISPDDRKENQIDHICIAGKFWRSLKYVRVKRGPDAVTDCHLLTATLKLKLNKGWMEETNRWKKFEVDQLKNL